MAMAEERLKMIETQNDTMWFSGAPLLICAVRLALELDTGEVFASAKFQNLYPSALTGMEFDVICYDQFRNPIQRLTGLRFDDLHEERNSEFGYERRIEIPVIETRNVEYILKQAVFEDGTVWNNPGDVRYDTRLEQQSIYTAQGDLNKQFLDICTRSGINGLNLVLQPEFSEEYWLCACGGFNWHDEEKCSCCKVNREWLRKSTDLQLLREKKETQENRSKEIQQQLAAMKTTYADTKAQQSEFEARKAHLLTEQRKEKKKKIRKRMRITGVVLVVLAVLIYLLMTFVFPRFLGRDDSAPKESGASVQTSAKAASVSDESFTIMI